jgi:hypothetical protein
MGRKVAMTERDGKTPLTLGHMPAERRQHTESILLVNTLPLSDLPSSIA